MRFDALRRWGPWHLLAASMTYWVVLGIVVLGSPVVRIWRLTHDPGRHGSASAGFRDNVVWATIVENRTTVWAASVHMITLTLWLVGPPLLLYFLWLHGRSSPSLPRDTAFVEDNGSIVPTALRPELGAGEVLQAGQQRVSERPAPL